MGLISLTKSISLACFHLTIQLIHNKYFRTGLLVMNNLRLTEVDILDTFHLRFNLYKKTIVLEGF